MRIFFLLAAFCGNMLICQAAEPTSMIKPGKELLNDKMATGLNSTWKKLKGSWDPAEGGGIKGAELKADEHGAVIKHDVKFNVAHISLAFKLDGAKQVSVSLNGAKGHVCRMAMSEAGIVLSKDDQDGKNGPDTRKVLANSKDKIEKGKWHTIVLELQNGEMLATFNGEKQLFGEHVDNNKPITSIGLTCAGESVSFKDFIVREGTVQDDWAGKNKSKFATPAKK